MPVVFKVPSIFRGPRKLQACFTEICVIAATPKILIGGDQCKQCKGSMECSLQILLGPSFQNCTKSHQETSQLQVFQNCCDLGHIQNRPEIYVAVECRRYQVKSVQGEIFLPDSEGHWFSGKLSTSYTNVTVSHQAGTMPTAIRSLKGFAYL